MTTRGRRAPIVFAAGGALALLAAGAIVSRTRVGDGETSPARVDAAEPVVVDEAPVPVASLEPEAQRTEETGAELSNATAAPDVEDAADDAAHVERAVDKSLAALAESLVSEEWSRARWDAALGATTGSLPDGAALRLVEVFHDSTRPLSERLVAAELLHKFGGARAALTDGATIDELRRLTLGSQVRGRASVAVAATRALAWLGDDVDRAHLLDRLGARSEAPSRKAEALWALAAAPADRLLPALCDRLESETDAGERELLLVGLDAALARSGPDPGDAPTPSQLRAADAALGRLLLDPAASERVRQRALVAAAAVANRCDGSCVATSLAACLTDPATLSDLRLRSAEALLRIDANRSATERQAAIDHLLAVARDTKASPPAERRRAWSALQAYVRRATDDDFAARLVSDQLGALADAESDAQVRATIQRASATK